jgi:3-oxoacyl-[acyl-carrier-protein] synthase III
VLGCDAEARDSLRVRGFGCGYSGLGITFGDTLWDFDGQVIFKRAVHGMSAASKRVMEARQLGADDIGLVVPHQANLRIIEAVAKYAGVPMDKVMLTVQKYGNMSAATVPVALVEALEEGRVKPGLWLLMPAFGGGLTYCALLVKWGKRVTPLGESDARCPRSRDGAVTWSTRRCAPAAAAGSRRTRAARRRSTRTGRADPLMAVNRKLWFVRTLRYGQLHRQGAPRPS